MTKEQSSKKTVEQIIREVCGIKNKNRKLGKMAETDIDIFADDDHIQIKKVKDDF